MKAYSVDLRERIVGALAAGATQAAVARTFGVGRATVQRYLATYRADGLDGLRRWNVVGPVSALADHADQIKASLSETPVRTVAEAADRIQQLTGLSRGLTQTRVFLKDLGLRWQRTRAVPVPPKSL